MKKLLPVLILALVAIVVVVVVVSRQKQTVEPIVWYGMAPHPYMTEVRAGAEAFAKDSGTPVYTMVGTDWSQADENAKVGALATKPHKAFSIFPGDAGGANSLFEKLKANGQLVVAYGAEPNVPTPAAFTVATDIPEAATMAAEQLIKFMGGKGKILNVLETVNDVNTKKRDDAIQAVVKKYPGVEILQTINDTSEVPTARKKIGDVLAVRGKEIDGIITTGYNPTIAAAELVSQWNRKNPDKPIHYVGIDTHPDVINAIRNGEIDATVAQNPFGHGYVSCTILKLMLDGWTPADGYKFINAGAFMVTRQNVETYTQEVKAHTEKMLTDVKTKYLKPPAGK